MKDWQVGRCAVCAAAWHSDLVWDHDHATALIRGQLCRSCNLIEGHGKGGPLFERYCERPPMVTLNLEARYSGAFIGRAEPEISPSREAMQAAVAHAHVPPLKSRRS